MVHQRLAAHGTQFEPSHVPLYIELRLFFVKSLAQCCILSQNQCCFIYVMTPYLLFVVPKPLYVSQIMGPLRSDVLSMGQLWLWLWTPHLSQAMSLFSNSLVHCWFCQTESKLLLILWLDLLLPNQRLLPKLSINRCCFVSWHHICYHQMQMTSCSLNESNDSRGVSIRANSSWRLEAPGTQFFEPSHVHFRAAVKFGRLCCHKTESYIWCP